MAETSGAQASSDVDRLVARHDGRAPRYTSYPTAPHFTPAVGASVYARWLENLPDAPLSLYLHVPFCDRLCLYCGCNTSVVRLESSHRNYAALLLREIDHVADLIGRRAAISHVHWGGGTPTSLPGDCLIAVMERLRDRFAFTPDAEIAIEIDPTSLPADRGRGGAYGAARPRPQGGPGGGVRLRPRPLDEEAPGADPGGATAGAGRALRAVERYPPRAHRGGR